jgi:hypothetical protein
MLNIIINNLRVGGRQCAVFLKSPSTDCFVGLPAMISPLE